MKKLLTFAMVFLGLFLSASSFAAISGSLSICVGNTTILFHDSLSTGGTWTSSNTAVATIGATYGTTGVYVNGISAGTSTISYSGSLGLSTVVMTVNPVPAAIAGGTTPFCVGSSITLTCATSGGTWYSTPTSIATVVSTTGVVTGVSGGMATVYYTIGGCSVNRVVTVNPGGGIDSLTGAYSVCVGSTTTFTSILSGGTWTSSSPSIATVSSGGVVTGVSAGTATITHATAGSCGTTIATHMITVTGAVTAGTISGPTSVSAGGSITLSSTVSGGTWSSGSTSIATVSGSGVVSGLTTGTCVITYTKTGCGGPAYATYTITVTAPDCISGNVVFGGAAYYGPVKVWLIKYNPTTLMLTACDSTYVYCTTGTSVYYSFCGMGTDSFRVKAKCDSGVVGTTGYLPTYHTSSAYWGTANVVYHTTGTTDAGKDINMGYGTVTAGPGFIGGLVTSGANKGTADGDPVVGLLVFAVNASTGQMLQSTYTDATGHYSFNNLPTGVAIKIYPELINYATTPYPPITLTSTTTSMTIANFIQHTISHTITPIVAGLNPVKVGGSSVSVFPNPAHGSLNVEWNVVNAGTGNVSVSDVAGRVVMTTSIDMNQANGTARINLNNIGAGLYMVSIKANGVNYNTKLVIE